MHGGSVFYKLKLFEDVYMSTQVLISIYIYEQRTGLQTKYPVSNAKDRFESNLNGMEFESHDTELHAPYCAGIICRMAGLDYFSPESVNITVIFVGLFHSSKRLVNIHVRLDESVNLYANPGFTTRDFDSSLRES